MATNRPVAPRSSDNPKIVVISLALALLTWLVFGQCLSQQFINYDDGDYVINNAHVIHGLTVSDVAWAFTSFHAGNWHPLTWISHMADVQLFGLNPSGHHFTNVLLHGLCAILLF